VPAVLGAFEFDDDQLSLTVYTEQIDAPAYVGKVSEFLGNYQQASVDHCDIASDSTLKVGSFQNMLRREGSRWEFREAAALRKFE